MDEFELIRRYFDRRNAASGVVVGIGDDGAVLEPTPDKQQVQVIDTLVEGVHFPAGTHPADIGYRVVAVNLSDVAAMGAKPRWMTLALTLAGANEQWLQLFSRGLFEAADQFDVTLVGGDTTSGTVITVTVTVIAEVEKGGALLRSGAKAGDGIYVTGTPGDAAAGLQLLKQGEASGDLQQRFLRPTAHLEVGNMLVGKASAAIDVSDGLVGDLRKLLSASGVGGEIDIGKLPISGALLDYAGAEAASRFALTGGDDYELCFTAADDLIIDKIGDIARVTRIGQVLDILQLNCKLDGDIVEIDDSGYRHFQ
jgi:thiamine-monophosphate kinase